MSFEQLEWKVNRSRELLHTKVFDVLEQEEESATGLKSSYVAMQAPNWVIVLPVIEDRFVMIRQWRHAAKKLTLEFPGGTAEVGEAPEVTAARELVEETGFCAQKMTWIGSCNPNPALFQNNVTFFLAEGLTQTGEQHPDEDEFLNLEEIPIRRVIEEYGTGAYLHAFVGTALTFYLRHKKRWF